MLKLKNVEPATLNRARWIFLIAPILWLVCFDAINMSTNFSVWLGGMVIIILLLLVTILALLMMVRKETISNKIILFIIILACISGLIYLLTRYAGPLWKIDPTLYFFAIDVSSIIAISSVILLYIIYFRFVEIIMPLSIFIILAGFLLNRIGAENEAVVILFLGFGFVSVGFIHSSIRSFRYFEKNSFVRRLLLVLGFILAFCGAVFLVKFASWEGAYTSTLDFVGAIFFLFACLILFAAMPFSNFIEWTKKQKQLLYRVFLIPMIFFLILFSLKFLLPGTSYQKIFFKGYAEKEKVFFGMKKYELKEPEEKEIGQD